MLQHREVLAVNQTSADNRQVYRDDNAACWIATDPESGDRYVALFNIGDSHAEVSFRFEDEMLRGRYKVRDLWEQADLDEFEHRLRVELKAHAAGLYRLSQVPGVPVAPVFKYPPAGPSAGPNMDLTDTLNRRIKTRSYPSLFQAWNPIDMPEQFPLETLAGRLEAAARHDVLWEEPVSQLGYGVDLVWAQSGTVSMPGLAEGFTEEISASKLWLTATRCCA